MLINSITFTRRILGLAAVVALALSLSAQQGQRDYSPSDVTADTLVKYKALMDAKNFAGGLVILDDLLTKVPAESYDAALANQYKMQVYLQMGDYTKAIDPMERSLTLSEAKTPPYFDERITRELYYFLVQLYFQEATRTKNATLSATYFEKADKAMAHWLKITPATNVDAQLIYAQLLFSRGMVNADKPDLALLQRALDQVNIGMKLATRPKDTFYILKLVCLQQLDRSVEAAEILELLLKEKPKTNAYWQQLFGIYYNIAATAEGKSTDTAKSNFIRSIVAMERAQSNGFMNSTKDNLNLVSIHFNIGQYERAAELLDSGLTSGQIDNELKSWELLSLCYQQLDRPIKGIDALKRATKNFPLSGQLEFLIAQAYTALEKPAEALPHIQAAVSKGNLTKPYQAYLSLAYTAYTLQKFDIALDAARKASEYPEGAKDGGNMTKALEDLMKDRESKKNKT